MKNYSILYQESTIHYSITGKGFPVMLLHGFGEDSRVWSNQIDHLADQFTLIVPDIPGSGKSDRLTGINSMEAYAKCINAILEKEGIGRLLMIGHSMGGYITLAFQEMYPEKLISFGLFHSSAFADDEAKKEARSKSIDFIQANGAQAFLKTSIPGLFMNPEKSEADIQLLLEQGKTFSKEALISYYEAMIARPDRTDLLKKATVPVLIIAGEHDKAVPYEHSLKQSHMPPNCSFNVLRNSAHMGMLEQTEASNLILANFLQNCVINGATADSILR